MNWLGTMRIETLARKTWIAREGVDDVLGLARTLSDEGWRELHPSVVERLIAAQDELSKAEWLLGGAEFRQQD